MNGVTTSKVLSVLPSSTNTIRQSENDCETTLSSAAGRYLAALNAGIITSTVAMVSIAGRGCEPLFVVVDYGISPGGAARGEYLAIGQSAKRHATGKK